MKSYPLPCGAFAVIAPTEGLTYSFKDANNAYQNFIFTKGAWTKIHTYPDGNKSTMEPKDGEKFLDNDYNTWIYDGLMERWSRRDAPKTIFAKGVKFYINGKLIDGVTGATISTNMIPVSSVICECGAEKAGVGSHSTWCPKYETDH